MAAKMGIEPTSLPRCCSPLFMHAVVQHTLQNYSRANTTKTAPISAIRDFYQLRDANSKAVFLFGGGGSPKTFLTLGKLVKLAQCRKIGFRIDEFWNLKTPLERKVISERRNDPQECHEGAEASERQTEQFRQPPSVTKHCQGSPEDHFRHQNNQLSVKGPFG